LLADGYDLFAERVHAVAGESQPPTAPGDLVRGSAAAIATAAAVSGLQIGSKPHYCAQGCGGPGCWCPPGGSQCADRHDDQPRQGEQEQVKIHLGLFMSAIDTVRVEVGDHLLDDVANLEGYSRSDKAARFTSPFRHLFVIIGRGTALALHRRISWTCA
jgi:hypothetical protein